MYLADRISEAWGKVLTVRAVQKLNNYFGRPAVTDAMRQLHGFPPSEAVRTPFAYIAEICKQATA